MQEESPQLNKTSSSPSTSPSAPPNETTPLILSQPDTEADEATALLVQTEPTEEIFGTSHHRFETRGAHAIHSSSSRGKRISAVALFDEEGRMYGSRGVIGEVTVAPVDLQTQKVAGKRRNSSHHSHEHGHAHAHSRGHSHGHGHFHHGMDAWHSADDEALGIASDELPSEETRVGRRRQIVGILVSRVSRSYSYMLTVRQ